LCYHSLNLNPKKKGRRKRKRLCTKKNNRVSGKQGSVLLFSFISRKTGSVARMKKRKEGEVAAGRGGGEKEKETSGGKGRGRT